MQTVLSADMVYETAQRLSERRLRLSPETTSKGFITLRGGHRMGLCGRVTCDEGELTLREISSVCIRVAHEIQGCGEVAAACARQEGGLGSILMIGAPGCGKTTMLRDAIRILSDKGAAVGLCDERGEIAACVQGVPQLSVGRRTHVLSGCAKAEGLRWLLRAMSPQLLATDEIYGKEECNAVLEAAACGVAVMATAHAKNMHSLHERPAIRRLLEENVFQRILWIADRRVCEDISSAKVLSCV